MYQYRQVLVRMRRGETDRQIARSKSMGRRKLAALRELAATKGWLEPEVALPEDEAIAAALGEPKRARTTLSGLQAHRERIANWLEQGVSGTAILGALRRDHGYGGSYSSVYRMMVAIAGAKPVAATIPLAFAPAEAAQVDFGAGPMLADADGVIRRTWAFVMTLCFSRHQYVEFVWDQTVATWLGCHRRAFEWFGAVPGRLIIDNAKCAITKASASVTGQKRLTVGTSISVILRVGNGERVADWDIGPEAFLVTAMHREHDLAHCLRHIGTAIGTKAVYFSDLSVPANLKTRILIGRPCGIRTCDQRIKSPLLYQLS